MFHLKYKKPSSGKVIVPKKTYHVNYIKNYNFNLVLLILLDDGFLYFTSNMSH